MASGHFEFQAILPVNTAAKDALKAGPKPFIAVLEARALPIDDAPARKSSRAPIFPCSIAGCAGPRPSTPSKSYFRTDASRRRLRPCFSWSTLLPPARPLEPLPPAPQAGHPLGQHRHLRNK